MMELGLIDKVVLISGSSRGLGLEIAKAFRAQESNVVLNSSNSENLVNAKAQLPNAALYVVADVSSQLEAEMLVNEIRVNFGRLDILVCNVGSGTSMAPGSEDDNEWDRMIKINLKTATTLIRSAENLLSKTCGVVTVISSICGIEELGAPVAYSASKAALNSFVRSSARVLARKGIRINAVAPGNLLFPGSVWESKLSTNPAAVNEMLVRDVALGRFGYPNEIADFVLFVSSERASFATGQIFVVDGGQLRS